MCRWRESWKFNHPFIAVACSEAQPVRFFGQHGGEFPSPLDSDDSARAEVIVEPDAERFIGGFEAVKVKVKQRQSPAGVFVDEGECRARDLAVVAEPSAESFYKLRLARAEVAIERHNIARPQSHGVIAA